MKTPSLRFRVEDMFVLDEGLTMFIGALLAGGVLVTPSEAELIVDNVTLAVIRLIREGKPSICGRRVLLTHDKVDLDLKPTQAVFLNGL